MITYDLDLFEKFIFYVSRDKSIVGNYCICSTTVQSRVIYE